MTVLEAILGLCVLFVVLSGWILGWWYLFHWIRRKHRLELEGDQRRHKQQMAEDYAQLRRELSEGIDLSYKDYVEADPPQPIVRGKRRLSLNKEI